MNLEDKHVAIEQLLYGQCKALYACTGLPGASNGISILQWWSKSGAVSYPHLVAAVRALLAIPSGNADLERVFGKMKAHLTPQKLRSALHALQLKINGAALGMRGYGASTTFDTHAEQHDSGSDAASDGESAAVLPDSDCEDEQAAEQAEDDVFEYDVFLDAGDVQCAVCSSTAHATLSCPFCCASFWADVKESDKTRQAIFTGAGIQLTSDQANLHVVLADGDCLFTCLGLELQRNLVPDFLESENIGQEVRSYFLAFVREHTGKFVFECPLPLWLEAASGLDFDAYLQGMATGSGIRDSSWGGFAEAHLICLQFGCKVEFYEQCRVGEDDLFQLAITGGDAESVMVCRLVWTGAHYNILELAADVSSTAAN